MVVRSSYSGLFVDEYQDCTLLQHEFIRMISEILPTRILGDPLQGIFNFEGPGTMVDLEDKSHMTGFHNHRYALHEPWRWKGQNEKLGEDLKNIRSKLEQRNSIRLSEYQAIRYIQIENANDLYNPTKKYYKDVALPFKIPSIS